MPAAGSVTSSYGFDLQASARVLVSVGGAVIDSYMFKDFGEQLAGSGGAVNPMPQRIASARRAICLAWNLLQRP